RITPAGGSAANTGNAHARTRTAEIAGRMVVSLVGGAPRSYPNRRARNNVTRSGIRTTGFRAAASCFRIAKRSLLSTDLWAPLLRLPKHVFHLVAVAELSAPLQNDFVGHIESLLDDEDVIHFVLDDDLTLMHHVILADDVHVPPVENLERG